MSILLYGYKIHTCRFIEERRGISGFSPLISPFSCLPLPQPGLLFSAVLHSSFLWLQNNKMLPLFVDLVIKFCFHSCRAWGPHAFCSLLFLWSTNLYLTFIFLCQTCLCTSSLQLFQQSVLPWLLVSQSREIIILKQIQKFWDLDLAHNNYFKILCSKK